MNDKIEEAIKHIQHDLSSQPIDMTRPGRTTSLCDERLMVGGTELMLCELPEGHTSDHSFWREPVVLHRCRNGHEREIPNGQVLQPNWCECRQILVPQGAPR